MCSSPQARALSWPPSWFRPSQSRNRGPDRASGTPGSGYGRSRICMTSQGSAGGGEGDGERQKQTVKGCAPSRAANATVFPQWDGTRRSRARRAHRRGGGTMGRHANFRHACPMRTAVADAAAAPRPARPPAADGGDGGGDTGRRPGQAGDAQQGARPSDPTRIPDVATASRPRSPEIRGRSSRSTARAGTPPTRPSCCTPSTARTGSAPQLGRRTTARRAGRPTTTRATSAARSACSRSATRAACSPTPAPGCRTPQTAAFAGPALLGQVALARLRLRHRHRLQPRQGHLAERPDRPEGQRKGGSIWLHMDHGSGTSACVSLPKSGMEYLLRTLDPERHPVVVMGDKAHLAA